MVESSPMDDVPRVVRVAAAAVKNHKLDKMSLVALRQMAGQLGVRTVSGHPGRKKPWVEGIRAVMASIRAGNSPEIERPPTPPPIQAASQRLAVEIGLDASGGTGYSLVKGSVTGVLLPPDTPPETWQRLVHHGDLEATPLVRSQTMSKASSAQDAGAPAQLASPARSSDSAAAAGRRGKSASAQAQATDRSSATSTGPEKEQEQKRLAAIAEEIARMKGIIALKEKKKRLRATGGTKDGQKRAKTPMCTDSQKSPLRGEVECPSEGSALESKPLNVRSRHASVLAAPTTTSVDAGGERERLDALARQHAVIRFNMEAALRWKAVEQQLQDAQKSTIQLRSAEGVLKKIRKEVGGLLQTTDSLRREHVDISSRCIELEATRLQSFSKVVQARASFFGNAATSPASASSSAASNHG